MKANDQSMEAYQQKLVCTEATQKIRYTPTGLEVACCYCDTDMRLLSTRQHQVLHHRDNTVTPPASISCSQSRWELGSPLLPAFRRNRTPKSRNCSLIFTLRRRFNIIFLFSSVMVIRYGNSKPCNDKAEWCLGHFLYRSWSHLTIVRI